MDETEVCPVECPTIVAVTLDNRLDGAPPVQDVLTRFGSAIRVRLGIHTPDHPNEQGLILLQLCCEDAETRELLNSLNAVSGVCAQAMKIEPAAR